MSFKDRYFWYFIIKLSDKLNLRWPRRQLRSLLYINIPFLSLIISFNHCIFVYFTFSQQTFILSWELLFHCAVLHLSPSLMYLLIINMSWWNHPIEINITDFSVKSVECKRHCNWFTGTNYTLDVPSNRTLISCLIFGKSPPCHVKHRKREPEGVHGQLEGCNRNLLP